MNDLFEKDKINLLKEYHKAINEILNLTKKCSSSEKSYIASGLHALAEALEKEESINL